ncbi:hypothetical protein V8F06_012509 [Rhypophila decipiens]
MSAFGPGPVDPALLSGDRGPSVVAVAVIGIVVSTLAVVMRFWSRAVASNVVLWWDDWAMLMTVVFSHTLQALSIWLTTVGLGKHKVAIPMQHFVPQFRGQRISLVFYSATIWGIKISALLLYGRLFRISSRFVKVLWATGAIVTAWWIIVTIYPWSFCSPIAKAWDPLLPGTCKESTPWYYASAFINAFLDLVVLLLPMPVIWRLQMKARRKIAVAGVLLIGYSSAFLSFARFIIIVINPTILSAAGPTSDPTWNLVPLLYLSMLEGPLAIIALCGPAIHQLLTRAINFGSLASLFTSRGRGTGKKSSGGSSGRQAGFSELKASGNVNTWPLATFQSTSSGTAINTPDTYPQKNSNDQLPQFSVRPIENLDSVERHQREKQMV